MGTAREETKAISPKTEELGFDLTYIANKLNALSKIEFQSRFKQIINRYLECVAPLERIRFKKNHKKALDIYENRIVDWRKDFHDFLDGDKDSFTKTWNNRRSLKLTVLIDMFQLPNVHFSQDAEKYLIATMRTLLFHQFENAKTEEPPVAIPATPVAPKSMLAEGLFKPFALEQKPQAKLPDEVEISKKLKAITEEKFPTTFLNSFNTFPLKRWAELSFPWRAARQDRLEDMRYMSWKVDLFDFLREETSQGQDSFKFHVLATFLEINKESYNDQEAESLIEKTTNLLRGMVPAEARKPITPSLGS